LDRSEINIINIDAYDKLAPLYKERTITTGRYPVLMPITLDDGRQMQFFFIDSTQYNFGMAFVDFLVRKGGLSPLRMLDIGTGAGNTLSYFADGGYKTVGVDISQKMCRIAKRVSPKSEILCGDIFDFPMIDRCFDAITMMSMLCQLPTSDAQNLLARVKQWIKFDTGYIYASTSVEENTEAGVFTKTMLGSTMLNGKSVQRFRTNYTISKFVELLESAGFEILMSSITYDKDQKSNRQFQGYICRVRS